jgi:dihydroxy-acid dehydratase
MPGIKTDREKYLAETQAGINPGSCMMVPTGADGMDNIGIGHFGYDFNHCNMHLEKLAKHVRRGINHNSKKLRGNLFALAGISDGISMGYDSMRHSLVSRDLMAAGIINHVSGAPYKGIVLLPGCDKNMPAAAMALFHLDIPGYIISGGSIMPGKLDGKAIDIVSTFVADGKVASGEMSPEERERIRKNACPGPGACGGMYTANSMFTIFEAMGISPLYSSSTMAVNKKEECLKAYKLIRELVKEGRTPSKILSKESFENAVRVTAVLGGSTNPILHLLAMARAAQIPFTEEDIERISAQTPFLGDLMPSGQYRMAHIDQAGGTPQVLRYMLENGHLDGNARTITGRTLGEDLEGITYKKDKLLKSGVIAPFDKPRLDRGHLVLLQGNIGTGWTKVSGSGLEPYEGRAVVFESQADFIENWGTRVKGEGDFVIIRNEGPKSSPGCPEMLKPTTLLTGKFGKEARIGLMTDGRFSGGSCGGAPIIGHVDETKEGPLGEGGLVGILQDGDKILINPMSNDMNLVGVSVDEILRRKAAWTFPQKVRDRIDSSPADLRAYSEQTTTAREGASMLTRFM